jgi:hypothetical protein
MKAITTGTALRLVQKYHPNVTSIVDAKKPIAIFVTQEDCKQGTKGAPNSCAMAKAFSRDWDGAIISKSVSYLINGTKAFRYLTPESVVREIVSFDRHQDFAPGKYGLSAASGGRSLGARKNNGGSTYRLQAVAKGHELGRRADSLTRDSRYRGKPKRKLKKNIHQTAGVRSLI